MDNLTKTLLIELSKTVLRVLDPHKLDRGDPALQQPIRTKPVGATKGTPDTNRELTAGEKQMVQFWGRDRSGIKLETALETAKPRRPLAMPVTPVTPVTLPLVTNVVTAAALGLKVGDYGRFWNGKMYVVGQVVSLCRAGKGQKHLLGQWINLRVEGPTGRGKTYKIEAAAVTIVRSAEVTK